MDAIREAAPPRRWGIWWVIAAVWWSFEGFTTAANFYRMSQGSADPLPWTHALETALWSAWLWIPLTIFALVVADRWPLDRDSWRAYLPVHAALAVAVCVARAVVVVALNPWIGWYAELPPFGEVVLASFANNLLLYVMLVGVGHALVYARRFRERDEQLARAELQALRMQLHPHFLFNALNTVNAYVRTDPDTAELMIARLGHLLRHALAGGGSQEVPLEEELRIVRAYLDIEQVRFEDRLQVRWKVDPGTHPARVPSLILQPLVENAVRHGIAPRAAAGTIEIAAERRGGTLHLSVSDDGVGMSGAAGEGVGLANTRARLRQLYGTRQSLDLAGRADGGVCVRVSLPFHLERTAG